MEPYDNYNDKDPILNEEKSFRCTYLIKDNNEIQIINNRGKVEINEEIESKIKILNGNKKEDLIFLKKFKKIGLNNMSFLFNKCNKLKEIKGIENFDTNNVINMRAMFQKCSELE